MASWHKVQTGVTGNNSYYHLGAGYIWIAITTLPAFYGHNAEPETWTEHYGLGYACESFSGVNWPKIPLRWHDTLIPVTAPTVSNDVRYHLAPGVVADVYAYY
jgi:hypothetical protein